MLIEPLRPASNVRPEAIGKLNAVALSAANIQAALEVLARTPPQAQGNPRAQAAFLRAYVRDAALPDDAVVAAALHARVTALAKWTATHDPDRQSAEAVIEATAGFPLGDCDSGVAFDPAGFQEMILFIEELPW
jgi:hypothetical protein